MDEATDRALTAAVYHARSYIDGFGGRAVGGAVTSAELRRRLDVPWTAEGVAADQVIDDLVAATAGGHRESAGGRFFAWVIGGALPSALAADWLTSAWDQNVAISATAPAAAMVEEICGAWLGELFGLPAEASFALTTGCQMAHVTALAAARHAVLCDAGWDVAQRGLFGAPPIRLIVNQDRHGSIDRAANLLGFGRDSLRVVDLDAEGRLSVEALRATLAESAAPAIVVLQAGDLNIAAFDPFAALIPVAKAAGAWVHVDGAFGLWAKASPRRRHLAEGVELANSWATDGHKWLNVPYDNGVVFVRDREAHRAAMTITASYIAFDAEVRDPINWNPDWSRRARGFTIYAALRELGRDGVADLVDRCCGHAEALAMGLAGLKGVELVRAPLLNQALVRFPDPSPGADEAADDRHTEAIIAAINATGEAFFGGATWRGRRVMRLSVINWRTTADDIRRAVAAVARVLGG